jgi:tetratricopeptide (TPR) repeat protein
MREIEEHLATCESCASDVAWARQLRDEALRQGLRHPDPMRIVQLASDPAGATDAERAHLASCAACSAEAGWAGAQTDESEEDDLEDAIVEPASPAAGTRRAWGWVWAAAAAAAAVLTLMLIPREPALSPSALARVEPLPVRITRDVPQRGTFDERRWLGLEAYSYGDYDSARAHLARAAQARPDDGEVLLYLGSSELLLGQVEAAIDSLRRARRSAAEPSVQDEASWQLANALVLGDRAADASGVLRELSEREGRRADDARTLLQQLEASD